MARFIWEMLADEVGSLSEGKLVEFESYLIAGDGDTQLFGDYLNVGGFGFLKLSIVGAYNIATNDGCSVRFLSKDGIRDVDADTDEIYSDYSAAMDYGITELDLDLENDLIQFIKSTELSSLEVYFDEETIRFTAIDQSVLSRLIEGKVGGLKRTKLFEGPEELEQFVKERVGDKEGSYGDSGLTAGRSGRSARIWGAVLIAVGIVLTLMDSNYIYTGTIVIGFVMLLVGLAQSSFAEKLRNK